jgi:aminoglycoside 3-N-acetyltransferase
LHLAPESTPEWIDFEEFETSDSVSETLPSDYFESIGLDYLASGQGQKGNVGASQSFLFDGPDFVRFAVNWLERSCRTGGT